MNLRRGVVAVLWTLVFIAIILKGLETVCRNLIENVILDTHAYLETLADQSNEHRFYSSSELIHFATAVDPRTVLGLRSLTNSLVANSNMPLVVHVMVAADQRTLMLEYLACILADTDQHSILPDNQLTFSDSTLLEIYFHRSSHMRIVYAVVDYNPSRIAVVKTTHRPDLQRAGNYIRFYLHLLLPHLDDLVYLDTDVILCRNLEDFLAVSKYKPSEVISAVNSGLTLEHEFLRSEYSINSKKAFESYYHRLLNTSNFAFNAGVMRMNLKLWRELRLEQEVEYWIDQQNTLPVDQKLWAYYGSQTPLLLVSHGRYHEIQNTPINFNFCADKLHNLLFSEHGTAHRLLPSIGFFHFTGPNKPHDGALYKLNNLRFAEIFACPIEQAVIKLFLQSYLPEAQLFQCRQCAAEVFQLK